MTCQSCGLPTPNESGECDSCEYLADAGGPSDVERELAGWPFRIIQSGGDWIVVTAYDESFAKVHNEAAAKLIVVALGVLRQAPELHSRIATLQIELAAIIGEQSAQRELSKPAR